MGELSKDELIYIKQQLQAQQTNIKNRNKSQQPKKTFASNGLMAIDGLTHGANGSSTSNKIFIIGQCNSNERVGFYNQGARDNHQIDSVNIYLQQSGMNKKRKAQQKGQQKQRRNMDLAEVCNDTTINTQHKDSITLGNNASVCDNDNEGGLEMQYDEMNSSIHKRENINIAIEEDDEDNEETHKTEHESQMEVKDITTSNSQQDKSSLHNTQSFQRNNIKLMSEISDFNNGKILIGHQTPISTNTANLYLTNSSNYTTQPQGISANPLTILNPGTQTMADRYSKLPLNNKSSAPSSLRKSTKLQSKLMADTYLKVMGGVPTQSISEKSQRNQSSQSKSIEGTQIAVTLQQTANFPKYSQSPRDLNRMVLQKVGLNLGTGSTLVSSILESKKKREPVLIEGQRKEQNNKYSMIKQEITIQDDKMIEENIQNDYQDATIHKEEDELENTQYLLNYAPAKPTLELKSITIDERNEDQNEVDDPYNDQATRTLQQQPNSTKNKENFQFQPQMTLNPHMTQPNFNPTPQVIKSKVLKQQAPPLKKIKVDSIIAQVFSVEPHFKRNMQKLGWIDAVGNLANFHVRFDITDKESNQGKLRPLQWYNHFPNNRELVTKAGLCKNLWQQCYQDYELKVASFFPRCYDLSDQKQIDEFFIDFQQTAILNIIKQYALHFTNKTKNIQKFLAEYKTKDNYNRNKIFKQKFKFKCSQYDQQMSGVGNLLGNDNLRLAMQYAKSNIVRKQNIDAKKRERQFQEDDISYLVEFSQNLLDKGIQNQKFPIYDQIKTIILHEQLGQFVPQYGSIDGQANVWVVKPSYNARGLGVYCSNKLKEIIQQGKKIQSKIVQKYIENPFLVNKKKFDIRQWVLVTSWEPLEVFIFEGAYLKICGNEYDLTNLSDQYSHLSNFSIQKKNNQFTNDDLVMSNSQFENFIKQTLNRPDYSWSKDLYPKLQDVIYRTFKGVQDSMEQRPNTFEIYGFDLILDESLNPWVIEVNLSPACNERTEWITKMLDDMSLDLLVHLENKIIQQNESEWESNYKDRLKKNQPSTGLYLNDESFYTENTLTHRWLKIEECLNEAKQHQIATQIMAGMIQNKIQFELIATKADIRQEKRLDKNYQRAQAVQKIQRVYQGYLGRKDFKQRLQTKSSILIQRYLRQQIAINRVKTIRKHNSALMIQKYLRKQIALNLVKTLIAEKILNAKYYVSLRLQSHFRRKQATKIYLNLRNNAKAQLIQTFLKRYLAQLKVNKMMTYKSKIVFIQKFYKRRFKMKRIKAIHLQKYLRGILSREKVISKLKISRGSSNLLKVYQAKKLKQAFYWLKLQKFAVLLQSFVRRKRCIEKYRQNLKLKAQSQIQLFARLSVLKQIKELAKKYRQSMELRAKIIQKYLRGYNSYQKVKTMYIKKVKSQKATFIQKYLRSYLAKNLVDFKRHFIYSVLKIQSFFRLILAKKYVNKLKNQKKLLDNRKKKDLEKKFGKNQKVEKEIENYIESLFQKEIQPKTIKQNFTSQTPLSGKRKGASSTNLIRQSMSSQAQLRNDLAAAAAQLDQPTTAGSDMLAFNKQEGSLSNTNQDFDQEAILAASMLDDSQSPNDFQTTAQDRQQKALRIRKSQKGQTGQAIMTNLVQNKGSKVVYQKELTNKVQTALNKVQKALNSGSNSNTQRQQALPLKNQTVHHVTKPKTFAENLMNMLAMQNIGQVFSENPVEALAVLKESKDSSQGPKRRNSIANKGDQSSNNSMIMKTSAAAQSEKNTIEAKPISFPKLNEFKSATNNIYLANRPLADPRQESEFQQALLDQKLKHQQQQHNTSTVFPSTTTGANQSRDHHPTTGSLHSTHEKNRKSQESLRGPQQHLEEQLMMNSRPGVAARETNVMVLQAYKKQSPFNPFDQYSKGGRHQGSNGQKRRADSVNPHSSKIQHQSKNKQENHNSSSKKSYAEMPPIVDGGNTKLVII